LPIAENEGVPIFYTTFGDQSNPPLVMLHGFLNSHKIWIDTGYVKVLEKEYFLILIDSRGYGKSYKSHQQDDYYLTHRVKDILSVMDELRVYKATIMGYSMGGGIAFAFAKYWPEKINALIIGGMSPYKFEKSVIDLDQRIDLLKDGMEASVVDYEQNYAKLPEEIKLEILNNDHLALMADARDTKEWAGIEEILKYIQVPVLYYVGDKDYFFNLASKAAKLIPKVTFVILEGVNHQSAYVQKAYIMPYLLKFLQEII